MSLSNLPFCCSVNFREYASPIDAWKDLGREVKASARLRREIVRAIHRDHEYLERHLLAILRGPERTRSEIAANRHALREYVRERIAPLVLYLARYFQTCDEVWLYLYAGETLRLIEGPDSAAPVPEKELEDLLQHERECFIRFFEHRISPAGILLFQHVNSLIEMLVRLKAPRELRVLFVGDCLFSDVVDFLRPKCADDGVSVFPVRITSKNPAETRQRLVDYSKQSFDAVFWSPFTYENLREYAYLLSWQARTLNRQALNELVDQIIQQTRETADILDKYYDCCVFVHNCGGFRRWEANLFAATLKSVATLRTRRTARAAINRWLQPYVEGRNAATFDHMFVLDEDLLVKTLGERTVGKYIFDGGNLHTAVFGKVLAEFYRDLIFVLAHLQTKKLIISDLDNTLWKGTIGEASVSPFLDRQAFLQDLKRQGVLLAVCSKNNLQDVSWSKNLLTDSDFVAARINWEAKPHNLRSIESELKLKRKDFVFLDDSVLERELMKAEFPEVLVLNPDEPRTWRLLKLWATLLGRGSTQDRTSYYRGEKRRTKTLEEEQNSSGDLVKALCNLQIKVKIRKAERFDLQRAVELINRTNQFNLCGARTSFREMQTFLTSPEHDVFVGHAEDKFGPMGIVCVAVTHFSGDALHIPIFVLSCRVIGYGIESAVLNYICMNAQSTGAAQVVGYVKITPHNEPCRQMYSKAGFVCESDGRWHLTAQEIPTPTWLTIDYGHGSCAALAAG